MTIYSRNKLVFSLNTQLFAAAVEDVEKVYRAMQITTLPEAPERLLGLANLGGRILPVVDIRGRLDLPNKAIDPDDRLVLFAGKMAFCFFVDQVLGVVSFAQEAALEPKNIFPKLERYLAGVGKYNGETVLFLKTEDIFSPIMQGTKALIDENSFIP